MSRVLKERRGAAGGVGCAEPGGGPEGSGRLCEPGGRRGGGRAGLAVCVCGPRSSESLAVTPPASAQSSSALVERGERERLI